MFRWLRFITDICRFCSSNLHVHFGMVNNKFLGRLTANIPEVTLGVESLNWSRELNRLDLKYSAITPPPHAALCHSRSFIKHTKQPPGFLHCSAVRKESAYGPSSETWIVHEFRSACSWRWKRRLTCLFCRLYVFICTTNKVQSFAYMLV